MTYSIRYLAENLLQNFPTRNCLDQSPVNYVQHQDFSIEAEIIEFILIDIMAISMKEE